MSKHPGALRAASSCVRLKNDPQCKRHSKIRSTQILTWSSLDHQSPVFSYFSGLHTASLWWTIFRTCAWWSPRIGREKCEAAGTARFEAADKCGIRRPSDVLPFWPACKLTNRRAGGIPLVPASPCWWQAQEKGPNHLPRDLLGLRTRSISNRPGSVWIIVCRC